MVLPPAEPVALALPTVLRSLPIMGCPVWSKYPIGACAGGGFEGAPAAVVLADTKPELV